MTGFFEAMAWKGSGLETERQNRGTFNSRQDGFAGFTFVEVLVAGCIIATLAVIAVPVVSDQIGKAKPFGTYWIKKASHKHCFLFPMPTHPPIFKMVVYCLDWGHQTCDSPIARSLCTPKIQPVRRGHLM